MGVFLLLFLVFSIIGYVGATMAPTIASCCPPGFEASTSNSFCYKVVYSPKNQSEASAHCSNLGGYLASVGSADENTELASAVSVDWTCGGVNMLIGIDDRSSEGTYVWDSGEPVTYTNFADTNTGELDCSVLNPAGTWNHISCTSHDAFVCEAAQTVCSTQHPTASPTDPVITHGCPIFKLHLVSGCYSIETSPTSYDAAKLACISGGGYIVSVDNTEENDALIAHLAQQEKDCRGSIYIGLTDQAVEGDWRLHDDTSASFFDWQGNSHSSSTLDCAVITPSTAWDDVDCTSSYPYICEFAPLYPSPAPTTTPSGGPTAQPSGEPTSAPTATMRPSASPTTRPSGEPSSIPSGEPSPVPSGLPSCHPSSTPSVLPSCAPTGQPSSCPTAQPSGEPSCVPSGVPSSEPSVPSALPSCVPSGQPSSCPTGQPSGNPSGIPSCVPSGQPSNEPSSEPSGDPSGIPSCTPTGEPSGVPSGDPSGAPSGEPSGIPSCIPSGEPSGVPSGLPSSDPSSSPSVTPSSVPSGQPSSCPTGLPSSGPSGIPSCVPSGVPSETPSCIPSGEPSSVPSSEPSGIPSCIPSGEPSGVPSGLPSSDPSSSPSVTPSSVPSGQPSSCPTGLPSSGPSGIPSCVPSGVPSGTPSCIPSGEPSAVPSGGPSVVPSSEPSVVPSSEPSGIPSCIPSGEPSGVPSGLPSSDPSSSPSVTPSSVPSGQPSSCPTGLPSSGPSGIPSGVPSGVPSETPSCIPSGEPSGVPSVVPSSVPSREPSGIPSCIPSGEPSGVPSGLPSSDPSSSPSVTPSSVPSGQPSSCPTGLPSSGPSGIPSCVPSGVPSETPSCIPSGEPSAVPSGGPSVVPSSEPSGIPSCIPSGEPSGVPSGLPSSDPSSSPSVTPSSVPSGQPSSCPTGLPSSGPSGIPSGVPSGIPSCTPIGVPSGEPSAVPSGGPSVVPSSEPSGIPSCIPSGEPSGVPSGLPSSDPSSSPSVTPSSVPSGQPSSCPTGLPSSGPSGIPSGVPSGIPSCTPIGVPSGEPSAVPSGEPSAPSCVPSGQPRSFPTALPSGSPSGIPSCVPTGVPYGFPSGGPSSVPSSVPSCVPYGQPSSCPTVCPTDKPSGVPSRQPSVLPSHEPSTLDIPSLTPALLPTVDPTPLSSSPSTTTPTDSPSRVLSTIPTINPSTMNTSVSVPPTNFPTASAPYDIDSLDLYSTRTEVVVHANLSHPGTLSCGAYVDGSRVPQSQRELFYRSIQIDRNDSTLYLKLTGLYPSTRYNIYCMILDKNKGYTESLDRVISSRRQIKTQCCIDIEVELLSTVIYHDVASINVLKVSMAPTRQSEIVLVLHCNFSAHNDSSVVSVNPFRSPVLEVNATSVSGTMYSSLPAFLPHGTYVLSFFISGPNATDYRVSYGSYKNFTVPEHYELPAPRMSRIEFSRDGTYLLLSFDSATDKELFGKSFDCSLLLDFNGSDIALCKWVSEKQMKIVLQVGLDIGDIVFLKSGLLQAACPGKALCETWPTSKRHSLPIAASLDTVVPSIHISSPGTIRGCESFVLDVSASTGHGGRNWRTVNITLSSPSGADVFNVSKFFEEEYDVNTLTGTPPHLFETNHVYEISVELCNFLRKCSSIAVHTLAVTDTTRPVTHIWGQRKYSIQRNSALDLYATVHLSSCNLVDSLNHVELRWQVFDSRELISNYISSVSFPSSRFRLDPFTLHERGLYTIILMATDPQNGFYDSDIIRVSVERGDIVAVLDGGSHQSICIGTSLLLDASKSFDENVAVVTGSAAGLSFSWVCKLIVPLDPGSCGVRLDDTKQQSVIALADKAIYINSTSEITLTVYDSERFDEAVVYVEVLPPRSTIISISRSQRNVVSEATVKLSASVRVFEAQTAVWTVDDTDLYMPFIALTPHIKKILPDTHYFPLILKASELPTEIPLTFSLSCGASHASVSVVVVNPPVPGRLNVVPESGIALSERFDMFASQWTDIELPLTYMFGYIAPVGSKMVLQARSECTYSSSLLPHGRFVENNEVITFVEVFNFLGARNRLSVVASVTPSNGTYEDLLLFFEAYSIKSSAEFNTDIVKQAVSIVSTTLNTPTCLSNCSDLNRYECLTSQNSCGDCMYGFYGDDISTNTRCYDIDNHSDPIIVGPSDPCVDSTDCGVFHECIDGVCTRLTKSCPNNCSDHGLCVPTVYPTSTSEFQCLVGDLHCQTICQCYAGFSGEDCSMQSYEAEVVQTMRNLMANAVDELILREYVTIDSAQRFADMVYEIGLNKYQLSGVACDTLMKVVHHLVDIFSESPDVEFTEVWRLYEVVSNCFHVYTSNSISQSSDNLKNCTSALSELTLLTLNFPVVDQDTREVIEDSFRISMMVLPGTTSGSVVIQPPQAIAESVLRIPAATVDMNIVSNLQSPIRIALTETVARLYENRSEIVANPLKIVLSNTSIVSDIYFFFNTYASTNFTNVTSDVFSTRCTPRDNGEVFEYFCPNGKIVRHKCSGGYATMSSTCSVTNFSPVCGIMVNGKIETETVCSVASYSNEYMLCQCSFQEESHGRRLGVFSAENGAEVFAMSKFVVEDFYDTLLTVDELGVNDLKGSVAVILMFIVLWISLLFLVSVSTVLDVSSEKKKINGRRMSLERKSSVTMYSDPKVLRVYLLDHFKGIFPIIFRPDSDSWRSLCDEIQKHHRYIKMFTARGPDAESIKFRTAMQMLTVQSMLIFFMAVFYDLQYPGDDGTCSLKVTEESCLHEKSVFDSDYNKCEWINVRSDEYMCQYRQVTLTTTTVILIGMMMTVFIAPINSILDFLFDEIICAPTADDTNALRSLSDSNMANKIRRVISRTLTSMASVPRKLSFGLDAVRKKLVVEETRKVCGSVLQSHALASLAVRKARSISDSKLRVSDVEATDELPRQNKFSILEVADNSVKKCDRKYNFSEFMQLLSQQNNVLTGESRKRLRQSWMLDESGKMESFPTFSIFFGSSISMRRFVKHEIQEVESIAKARIKRLRHAPDVHIGLELCHMFVMDLLGRTTPEAKIFEYKTDEEFGRSIVVTSLAKGIAWFLVFLINIFFVFFTLLRSIERDLAWQKGFMIACLIQMVVEVFVFESMECLWIHYSVPSLVREDVETAVQTLYRAINCSLSQDMSRNLVLNAPDYFFVSNRVARMHPTLFESSVILSYQTYLGGNVAKHLQSKVRKRSRSTLQSLIDFSFRLITGLTVVGIMKAIGCLPLPVQRLAVHAIQPAFLTALLYAISMIVKSPWISRGIIIFFLSQLVIYIVYSRQKSRARVAKISKILSAASGDYSHSICEDDESIDDLSTFENDASMSSPANSGSPATPVDRRRMTQPGTSECVIDVVPTPDESPTLLSDTELCDTCGINDRCRRNIRTQASLKSLESFSQDDKNEHDDVGLDRTEYVNKVKSSRRSWSFGGRRSSADYELPVRQVVSSRHVVPPRHAFFNEMESL